MATPASYLAEQKDLVALEHAHMERARTLYSIVRPGLLGWLGPWLPRVRLGWRDLKRETHALKIRWGWVLLLAVALILAMGECSPAVSAIAAMP
jgi:hypothetical protein